MQPLDLVAVIGAAVDVVKPAAQAKGIEIRCTLDPHAGEITGDSDRLQQVVWNLLTNAVKFTPEGGRVELRCERLNEHVQIEVSDSGFGIEADVAEKIFDAFEQGVPKGTTGLGLGLAISKALTEFHGGNISARSAGAGRGTTFAVNFPVAAPLAALSHADGFSPPVPVFWPLRIMVVDDHQDTASTLARLLIRRPSR